MVTEQKRAPISGVEADPGARRDASLSRKAAESHVEAVHRLLEGAQDLSDVQTQKNLRARGVPLEPEGVLLSFCLSDAPDGRTLAERGIDTRLPHTLRDALSLAEATARAFGSRAKHVVVHGERQVAHVRPDDRGDRACVVDVDTAPSEAAIQERLEGLKCAP
jgi:hypothetical protein